MKKKTNFSHLIATLKLQCNNKEAKLNTKHVLDDELPGKKQTTLWVKGENCANSVFAIYDNLLECPRNEEYVIKPTIPFFRQIYKIEGEHRGNSLLTEYY